MMRAPLALPPPNAWSMQSRREGFLPWRRQPGAPPPMPAPAPRQQAPALRPMPTVAQSERWCPHAPQSAGACSAALATLRGIVWGSLACAVIVLVCKEYERTKASDNCIIGLFHVLVRRLVVGEYRSDAKSLVHRINEQLVI